MYCNVEYFMRRNCTGDMSEERRTNRMEMQRRERNEVEIRTESIAEVCKDKENINEPN